MVGNVSVQGFHACFLEVWHVGPRKFRAGRVWAGVGLPQDKAMAYEWLRRAAEPPVPEAQFNLGLMHQTLGWSTIASCAWLVGQAFDQE